MRTLRGSQSGTEALTSVSHASLTSTVVDNAPLPTTITGTHTRTPVGGPVTLTRAEAEQLTKQLQSKTQTLAKLISKAHDEQVWVPLGYSSFTKWAEAELPFTYARAFQLLNIGILTEQLQEVIALPEDFTLTDLQSRGISTYGRKLFMEAMAEEATDDPARNVSKINELISEKPIRTKEPEEKVKATIDQQNTVISGGGSSWTHKSHIHSLRVHAQEFPNPKSLDAKTREQGISILLQAHSNVDKMLNDLNDKNNKYVEHQKKNGNNS